MTALVIDTNVLVGALRRRGGTSRRVLRACLAGDYQPLMGAALFAKCEDVLSREALWRGALVPDPDREVVLDGFLKVCRWVEVSFAWRPNLPDESDNHLVELAIAGNAAAIVTRDTLRDVHRMGEFRDDLAPGYSGHVPHDCAGIVPYATGVRSC